LYNEAAAIFLYDQYQWTGPRGTRFSYYALFLHLHYEFLLLFSKPRIQDCLDTVAGATIFSTFDLTSGYHQIPVRSEDIHKTAFVTKYGLFEFQTMYGL
jgi:hypothetical protein